MTDLLKGAGISYRRENRLDVALCAGLPLTLVFLPAADIAKYVGDGNVDLGITGIDIIEESDVTVDTVMNLNFGACKLCVQAPVAQNITDVSTLAGGRIVTSFPHLTKKYFDPLDKEKGVTTKITEVSGSVEAACGLGLADAVVDLVETGTTMRVRFSTIVKFFLHYYLRKSAGFLKIHHRICFDSIRLRDWKLWPMYWRLSRYLFQTLTPNTETLLI